MSIRRHNRPANAHRQAQHTRQQYETKQTPGLEMACQMQSCFVAEGEEGGSEKLLLPLSHCGWRVWWGLGLPMASTG